MLKDKIIKGFADIIRLNQEYKDKKPDDEIVESVLKYYNEANDFDKDVDLGQDDEEWQAEKIHAQTKWLEEFERDRLENERIFMEV